MINDQSFYTKSSHETENIIKEELAAKQEKLSLLFQKAKLEFEQISLDEQGAEKIFNDAYSEYADDEKIILRDGRGEKIYNIKDEQGEESCEQPKHSFDLKDKHAHIAAILELISLEFNSISQSAAINRLLKYPQIMDLAEIKGSELKKTIENFVSLNQEIEAQQQELANLEKNN